ncbi:MAG: LuxR C-terminal-related transcriptional regulator [Cytophagales bacterium]|nr:LuxR C-terminal-related transcriptional regulator [Cytophagales bacterium]
MIEESHHVHLYEIARLLNREYALPAALRSVLKKTVEIFEVESGWIWLTEPDQKSVYLAASYQLPPALSNHPERLSGWCWCIKQYLSDEMEEAINISEIKCSRLVDLETDTRGLLYHATIPIMIADQKVGLMNLLSQASRQLDEQELSLLNTVSELIGSAIERTRLQQTYFGGAESTEINFQKVITRVFQQQLTDMRKMLEFGADDQQAILTKVEELQHQLKDIAKEVEEHHQPDRKQEFHYPELPLTKRELEVIALIKQGRTNAQIGEQLYIAERTVKFHVTSILSKLHASTRTEAVDICLKRGLLRR